MAIMKNYFQDGHRTVRVSWRWKKNVLQEYEGRHQGGIQVHPPLQIMTKGRLGETTLVGAHHPFKASMSPFVRRCWDPVDHR